MRAFLGIPIPVALGRDLVEAAGEMAALSVQKPENLHLTIRFLGSIANAEAICKAVAPVAAAHQPFDMILKGIGAFPDLHEARVVWVGLDRGDLQAGSLAKGVESALVNLGFPREGRPFRGHITLGRFKRPQRVTVARSQSFGAVRADRLVLYRSVLTVEGTQYEVLEEMSLGGAMTPGRD